MANAEHLAKLREGPVAWNAWRERNPDIAPDLAEADLALGERQFGPIRGGPINLSGTNLEGAMLRFATLTGADLGGARLAGADLMYARLDRARLVQTDFTDALLDNADMTGASLDGAVLIGASMQNVRNLTQMQVQQAYGDASTLLPGNVVPPQEWFPAASDEPEEEEFFGCPVPEQVEEEDPYTVLGLTPEATQDQVRAAYRSLVKKLHPDLNPGDPGAELRFRQINDAYQELRHLEEEAEISRQVSRRRMRWGMTVSLGVIALAAAGGAVYWLRQQVHQSPGVLTNVRDDIARSATAGSGLGEGMSEHVPAAASKIAATPNAAEPPQQAQPQSEQPVPPAQSRPSEVMNTAAIADQDTPPDGADQPGQAPETSGVAPAAVETPPQQDGGKTIMSPAAWPSTNEDAAGNVAQQSEAAADHRPDGDVAPPPSPQETAAAGRAEKRPAPASGRVATAGAGWEDQWRTLQNSSDLLAIHGFIARHPGKPPVNEARARLRNLIGSLQDQEQLNNFIKGAKGRSDGEVALAKQRLAKLVAGDAAKAEQAAWAAAVKTNSREGFEGYVRSFPKGPHTEEAATKVEALKEAYRKRDEAAWVKARREHTRAAYNAYLAAYPRGYFVRDARKILAGEPVEGTGAQGGDGFPSE